MLALSGTKEYTLSMKLGKTFPHKVFQAQGPFLFSQVRGKRLHAFDGLSHLLASSGSELLHKVLTGFSCGDGHLSGAEGSASKEASYRAGKAVLAIGGGSWPLFTGPLHTDA